ncbi:MAG: hypothetical protein J0L92_35905 [Deltaproteobacteria bacterium]|nr:hypothetical protein [Deltaproteobacteria bacterium]
MRERARHVVVSTTRTDAGTRAIANALGELLEDPSAASAAIALPIETDAHEPTQASIEGADVLVALDAVALEKSRGANVGLRIAFWPGLGDAWLGSVEGADAVLVPHASSVDLAIARGAARADVEVVGPLAPEGFARATDRAATIAELLGGAPGAGTDTRILLVPFPSLPGADLSATFTQLALVKEPLLVVFDVEDDVDAAKSIRSVAPRFGLRAALVSDRELARAMYGVADLVLARLEGPESFAALASGAPVVILRPKTKETEAAKALVDAGLVAMAGNVSMLAVTLDLALAEPARLAARDAITKLAIAESGARVKAAIDAAGKRHRPRATGLPRGIEILDTDPLEAAAHAIAPLIREHESKKKAEDAAIDAELAELKKRIGG